MKMASALVSMAIVGSSGLLRAQEAATSQLAAATKEKTTDTTEDPERGQHRLLLGAALFSPQAGGLGAVGGLAGGFLPVVRGSYETRVVGDTWFFVDASGGYSGASFGDSESSSVSGGARLGLRYEAPVFSFASIGPYAALGASAVRVEWPDSVNVQQAMGLSVAGTAGVSLHFHASSFFGVRLGLELLQGGYSYSRVTEQQSAEAWGVGLAADPEIALSFTF